MAAVFPFDTHKFVRKLKSAGFNDPQAEALTEAVQESYVSAELATKADLREYKSAIRNDLEKLETNLRCEINDLQIITDRRLIFTQIGFRRKFRGYIRFLNCFSQSLCLWIIKARAFSLEDKFMRVKWENGGHSETRSLKLGGNT